MKQPILRTDILTDILRGIHTVTTYYDDGTSVTENVPKGPILVPPFETWNDDCWGKKE